MYTVYLGHDGKGWLFPGPWRWGSFISTKCWLHSDVVKCLHPDFAKSLQRASCSDIFGYANGSLLMTKSHKVLRM